MTRPLINRSPMPGLGLSMGITLTMVSLIVLLPLGALLAKGAGFGPGNVWDVVNRPRVWAALFLSFACLGVVMPTTMVLALDPHPDLAGLASSLGGAIQMLTAAAIGSIAGLFFDGTPGPMLAGIAVCGALTWGAAFLTLPRLSLRP